VWAFWMNLSRLPGTNIHDLACLLFQLDISIALWTTGK